MLASACGSTAATNLAPVTVRGSVQTLVLNRNTSGGRSETAATATGNVAVDSYVWHPWFATVGADMSIGYDFSTGGERDSALRAGGSVKLDVLPQSNYPVSFSASHYESRISGDFVSGDFVRDSAAVSARATITPTIRSGLLLSWDRTDQSESGVRTGLNSNLTFDKTFARDDTFLGLTSVGLQATYRRNDFTATDINEDDSVYENSSIRLTFHGEPTRHVLVDGRFSASLLDFESDDDEDTRLVVQGLTTVQWRPETMPFTMTGALRLLWEDVSQTDAGRVQERSTKLVSATAGARWPVDDNLTVNIGLRASYEDVARDAGIDFTGDSDETGARIEGGFVVGVNYRSDSHDVRGFDWRWNARVLTDNGFDSRAGFDSRELFQIRHQFDRQLEGIFAWPLVLSLSQGFDVRLDTEDADGLFSAGITHALSLGYTRSDQSSNRYARLTVRDSRNVIGETRSFQSIAFRLGERLALSRYQRVSGDVSARYARSVDDDGDADTSASLAAELRYEHRELFDVDGLFFRSILRASVLDVEALFGIDEESLGGFATVSNDWRNILTYRIGRLSAETEASAFYRDDGFGYLVMLRLRREFGGTF